VPSEPVSTPEAQKAILFFGNSLTAGYGLDPEQAFPALIQQKIDSLGLGYRVVNAGLSGETTTGGLERIDFLLRQPFAVVVVELGGNDGLRGIDPALSKKNLQGIIDKIRQKDAQTRIVLAGMEAPPSMGQDYTRVFRGMYQELSQANRVALIPFLLERVGGDPKLNLPDGIHPTAEGHRIVAETVWQVLKPVLQ
jgi:acyl-CoA thioesterase I